LIVFELICKLQPKLNDTQGHRIMTNNSDRYLMAAMLLCLSVLQVDAQAKDDATHYGMDDFYRVPKIDTHMHLHSTLPTFMLEAQRDNFRVLSINVDNPDRPSIDEQQRISEVLLQKYPDTFAFAATFSVSNYDQPGWQESVIKRIDTAVSHGAVAVKVWKNIGMSLRAANGAMVMIDDPHFKPVFDHLEKIHLPVLGHQGEPKNCWLQPAQMTVKGDREYFEAHPQYYMYLHPDMPSYEDQIRARDHMLDQHKNLQFAALHLASLEWSVEALAQFLDRYPNTVVDLASRIAHLQAQANQNSDTVRNFLIKYQDRIMYGTDSEQAADMGKTGVDQKAADNFSKETLETWRQDWRFFNTTDIMPVPDLDQPVKGLALPKSVVDKIYHGNAERFFPAAWGKRKAGNQAAVK